MLFGFVISGFFVLQLKLHSSQNNVLSRYFLDLFITNLVLTLMLSAAVFLQCHFLLTSVVTFNPAEPMFWIVFSCFIFSIVAFHSFLVWLGCGSSLTSQHFACPISLNLGDESNSALWGYCSSTNLKVGLTHRKAQNMWKLFLKNLKAGSD